MSLSSYFASLSLLKLVKNLPGGAAQGLIWGIMALGIYITFRLLDVADLTVDGSFTTGGAVTVMLILAGWPAWAALCVAVLAGMLAGMVTGLLHTRLGIPAILAGILTQFALYSVNLHIMGMAANRALSVDKYPLLLSSRHIGAAIGKGLVIAAVIVAGIGASTAYAFEQVYLGKRSLDDLGLYRRFKKSERWQAAKSSAVSKLHEVTDEATLDGIALSIVEMLKTLAPTT